MKWGSVLLFYINNYYNYYFITVAPTGLNGDHDPIGLGAVHKLSKRQSLPKRTQSLHWKDSQRGETEAHRGEMTCPRSDSRSVTELGVKSGLLSPSPVSYSLGTKTSSLGRVKLHLSPALLLEDGNATLVKGLIQNPLKSESFHSWALDQSINKQSWMVHRTEMTVTSGFQFSEWNLSHISFLCCLK